MREDHSGGLAKPGILAVAAIVALVALALAVQGTPAAPSLDAIETGADYTSVTLTFNEEVFPMNSDGTPSDEPLGPGNFSLDDPGEAKIESVAQGADRRVWTLTFDKAVTPHNAELTLADETVGNSVANVSFVERVPFAEAELDALANAITTQPFLPGGEAEIPFVQHWLAEDRALKDLVPNLASVPTGVTEKELVGFLEAQDGIGAVVFDGYDATLVFDDLVPASKPDMGGNFAVGADGGAIYEVSLEGTMAVDVHLAGNITFQVGSEVTPVLGTGDVAPTVSLRGSSDFTGAGRLGIVDVSGDVTVQLGADLSVTDSETEPVTVGGTLAMDLTEIRVADAGLPPFAGSPLLGVEWEDLSTLLVCEDGSEPDEETRLCGLGDDAEPALQNLKIVPGSDAFDATGLRAYTRVGMDHVLGGLGLFAGLLGNVEDLGALGHDLPVIEGSIGTWTSPRGHLEMISSGLNDLAGVSGLANEAGSISAQDLMDVCSLSNNELSDLAEAVAEETGLSNEDKTALKDRLKLSRDLCDGVLTSIQITGQDIRYTVAVQHVVQIPLPEGRPFVDLGLGEDLAGFVVDNATGTWAVQTTVDLDFVFGIRLDPVDDLPIDTDKRETELAHRAFVMDGQVANLQFDATGSDIAFGATLGFLDVKVEGDFQADASVGVHVDGPGSDRASMQELINAALHGSLGDLVDLQTTGEVEAAFTLSNDLVFDSDPAIQVRGPLAALAEDDPFVFHAQVDPDWDFDAGRINVGHSLGDGLNLKNLTTGDVVGMVAEIAERMASLAEHELMALSIPFVDVRFQEAVGFVHTFSAVAQDVADRRPENLTGFDTALSEALGVAGLSEALEFAVTGEELAISLSANREVSRSYPFSFAAPGVGIAPADGGASLSTDARLLFEPTIGILFGDQLIGERVFIRGQAPAFEFELDADAFGSVYLGPLSAGVEGRVQVGDVAPARLEVDWGPTDPDGRVTMSQLADRFAAGGFSVDVGGALEADLKIVVGAAEGTLNVAGDLSDLDNVDVQADFSDFTMRLDMDTLVFGTVETARFVARLVESSDMLGTELPILGDVLRSGPDLAADLDRAADAMDQAWRDAPDEATFLAMLKGKLEDALCDSSSDCTVTVTPSPDSLHEATEVEIRIEHEESTFATRDLRAGVDLSPVFDLDFDAQPGMTVGHSIDLVLGLSLADGFYVRAGGGDGADALELFAGVDVTGIDAEATALGIEASIDDGNLKLAGGGLGPDDTAGGFAIALDAPIGLRDLSNRARAVDETMTPRFEGKMEARLPVVLTAKDFITMDFPVFVDVDPTADGPAVTLRVGQPGDEISIDVASLVDGVVDPVLTALSGFDPAEGRFNPLAQEPLADLLDTEVPVMKKDVNEIITDIMEGTEFEDDWAVASFLISMANGKDVGLPSTSGGLKLGYVTVGPDLDPQHVLPVPFDEQGAPYQAIQLVIDDDDFSGADGEPQMLRFPILEDPSLALGLIIGGEDAAPVTLALLDPGELGMRGNLPPIEIPIGAFAGVTLTVGIEAGFEALVHTGFGYDSTGVRTGDVLNGLFLIDNEGHEVGLGGRVTVSINGRFGVAGIGSVKISGYGGVAAFVGVDLFDDSIALPASHRNDGRMHLEEIRIIGEAYEPPIEGLPSELCMFKAEIELTAHLGFSGRLKILGKTVWKTSYSKEFVIVDETYTCNIIHKSAHVDARQLNLNGGVFAERRYDGTADLEEHFEVKPNGNDVEVIVRTHPLGGGGEINEVKTVFPNSAFDVIFADLGDGDDVVTIHPGIDKRVVLFGGDGNDKLTGGPEANEFFGGPGKDTLNGGGGSNVLSGGPGDDTLVAGGSQDVMRGGVGVNTYVFPEAWGEAEVVDGTTQGILEFQGSSALTGTASFYDGRITAGDHVVSYQVDHIQKILGGTGPDTITVNRYAPEGLVIDLGLGSDAIHVPFSGVDRTIRVEDSGGDATLFGRGTSASDIVLFRARGDDVPLRSCLDDPIPDPATPATNGFIALVTPTDAVDRVDYDDSISAVDFDANNGNNLFVLDDVAAPVEVHGGPGNDRFQVGQIFGTERVADNVAAGDEVRTRCVAERGPMSFGVSHPTTLNGGAGDDFMQVYSNVAPLNLNGDADDDTFVLRAFILEGTVTAAGGDGRDRFEYVPNEKVTIDGGTGFDTLIVVGTELSDGFLVDASGVLVCPQLEKDEIPDWAKEVVDRLPNATSGDCGIDVDFEDVESLIVHGLHGNDAFWVRSTSREYALRLFGGTDGATFLIGDQGDLTGIQGPVHVDGEADPEFDASVPAPVVLPGEDATPSGPGIEAEYHDQENEVVIDGFAATAATSGNLTDGRIFGLGMGDDLVLPIGGGESREFPGGVTYLRNHNVTVRLGSGDDNFTVESTQTFGPIENLTHPDVNANTRILAWLGDDDVSVRTIAGPTTVETGSGHDVVRAGSFVMPGSVHPDRASTMTGVGNALHVQGGDQAGDTSHLILEASGTVINSPGERVDVEQGLVTQLAMPGQVTHEAVDLLEIFLTEGDDVANVRGTSTHTIVHGLEADDRYFVSDAAFLETTDPTPPLLEGTLNDVGGDLDVEAGPGTNLLMVSDRSDSAPIVGGVVDAALMTGLADGAIAYDAEGTFAAGITIWTGSGPDEVSVVGTRLDGDPTTVSWEGRTEAVDVRTVTTLNTRAGDDTVGVAIGPDDGFLVVNTGLGDDVVNGSASTLGFIALGGEGNDEVTTGAGDDVVFGDLGRVEYCTGGTLAYHGGVAHCMTSLVTLLGDEDVANLNDGLARKPARIHTIAAPAGALDAIPYAVDPEDGVIWPAGFHNRIQTGAGDDMAFGGAGSDVVAASGGANVLVGDEGEVWRFANTDLGGPRNVATKDPFLDEDVLTHPIAYVVDVAPVGSGDVLLGGVGPDWVFAGVGDDIVNAGVGDDIVWAGDGHDLLWGGVGDDRLYSGNGEDVIDLKRSSWDAGLTTPMLTDAAWWALAWHVAPEADADADPFTDNGNDVVYGGRARDILHADRGRGGPDPGDRLMDWTGSYNLYLVCDGPYGAGQTLRDAKPDKVEAILDLARADGVFDVDDRTLSGWTQLALAVDEHANENRGKAHPDHPGNHAGC